MSKLVHMGLSGVAFIAIWTAVIVDCIRDTRIDVDLGISTSKLSLTGNALWSFPLTVFWWALFESALLLVIWIIRRIHDYESV